MSWLGRLFGGKPPAGAAWSERTCPSCGQPVRPSRPLARVDPLSELAALEAELTEQFRQEDFPREVVA